MMVVPFTCVLFDLYGTLLDVRLNEDSPALWDGLATAIGRGGGVAVEPADVRLRYRRILEDEAQRRGEGFLMEATFGRLLAACGALPGTATIGWLFRELSLEHLSIRPCVGALFDGLHRTSCTLGIGAIVTARVMRGAEGEHSRYTSCLARASRYSSIVAECWCNADPSCDIRDTHPSLTAVPLTLTMSIPLLEPSTS
jgi:hypothetical protein